MQGQIESQLMDFEVLSKIGEGAYGQVFRVRRRSDGLEYALKKVKIDVLKQKQRDNALNEIRIMASYDGDNDFIIGYKEAFYDQNTRCLCIVMELAEKGDLHKTNLHHIKHKTKYSEQEIWNALIHITQGLKSLHDKKILHRDLKSANVFITAKGELKLGDLNVSKVLKKDLADTQTGTPYYASPQVWKDQPYGAKSDIWSLGCVLYEMAALKPPFVATDLKGLYRKVCAGKFQRIPSFYSKELHSIISTLLETDPKKRPTADQILSLEIINNYRVNSQQKMEESQLSANNSLLKTIKCNMKNMKDLKHQLPKSNYIRSSLKKQEVPNLTEIQENQQIPIDSLKKIKTLENVLIREQENIKIVPKITEDKKENLIKNMIAVPEESILKKKILSLQEPKCKSMNDPSLNIKDPKISLIRQILINENLAQQKEKKVHFDLGPSENYHLKKHQKYQNQQKKQTYQHQHQNEKKQYQSNVHNQIIKKHLDYKIPAEKATATIAKQSSSRQNIQSTHQMREVVNNNYVTPSTIELKDKDKKAMAKNVDVKQVIQSKNPKRPQSSNPIGIHSEKNAYKVVYPSWWG